MLYNKFILLIIMIFSSSIVFAQADPQKRTDTPHDQAIKIKTHDGGKYCYSPYILKGEGYVYLSDCRYATPARYDVFQRIAWKVNSKWLCMTAPAGVTGILEKATQQWDYLRLRPCDMNNPNQRWVITNDAFYTADGKFRVKDYNWWAFISKNPKDYYNHTIDMSSMQTWINTIATPGTITMHTSIGWIFISPTRFAVYYLQNNQSYSDEIKFLYYNPDNGHIAQYYPDTGAMYCLASYHGKSQDWNWAGWENCNDDIPKNKDNKYWEFFDLNGNEGTLRDKDGNFLRVAQYGPNWGVPYTAKPAYLTKDTTSSPKSLFLFDPYIDQWNRYVDSNLSDSLQYCPAPGNKKELAKNKRVVRSLPPSFTLTDEWIRRFWQIATTTQAGSPSHISYCGICLLQSYQMISELQHYYLGSPLTSGGYFFDTALNTDPFISFRQRFPILAERLEGTMNYGELPYRAGEDRTTRSARVYYAMALTMLSRYNIVPSRYVTDINAIRTTLTEMFNAPLGTLWIVHYVRTSAGGPFAHGQPVLRTAQGLMFIPTNVVGSPSFEDYRNFLRNQVAANADAAIALLATSGQTLMEFMSLRINSTYQNDANTYISNNNCTGQGDGRRGSLVLPRSSTLNQCLSGRCSIQ